MLTFSLRFHVHFLLCFEPWKIFMCSTKGSQLEIMLPQTDETNINQFVQSWITAAGDAAGQCAKLTADLEPLESQQALIQLLQASAAGITNSRKLLTALGPNPVEDQVTGILQQVSWQQKPTHIHDTCDYLFFFSGVLLPFFLL